MALFKNILANVFKNQKGAIFAEYALLATLIAVASVAAVAFFSDSAAKLFKIPGF